MDPLRITMKISGFWLLWGETDVSELRPLRTYCSCPGDCDVDHGMMILIEVNSQLVYHSALAATSTVWQSCHQIYLWREWESGRRKWEFSLSVPVGLQEFFYMP
jgi:hypothetical protein